MSKVYVGLEIGSNDFYLYAINEEGEVLLDREIPVRSSREGNQQVLTKTVGNLGGNVHLHHEVCGMDGWLLDTLSPVTEQVYASDPLQNSWIARDPDKEDSLDAEKLAKLLRMDTFRRVFVSGCRHRREFRRIVSHRQQMVKKEVRLLNQIKAQFRQEGILVKESTKWPESKRERYLEKVSETIQHILRQKFSVLDAVRDNREKAEKLTKAAASAYPEVSKLKEAPGVGDVTAARFVARITDPHRFDNKRKLIRYCGLAVVSQNSDGKELGYQRLNKDGVTKLKGISNMIFQHARRTKDPNGFSRFFRESLARTGNATNARLNTQRKIVVTLWTIWKKDLQYEDRKVCGK